MSEKNKTKNDYVAILFKPIDNNEENVRIFGREFVKNNKHKCYIEYKDKKFELCEYFEDIDNNYNHKDEILFFLIGINHINNMSYLFADCNTLSSLLIFSGNDFMKNLEQINGNFSDYILSIHSNTESNWNSSSKNDTKDFYMDNSLFSLKLSKIKKAKDSNDFIADISFEPSPSSLINSNVNNMNHLFYNCKSLITLPDITNFDTSNVINISFIFYGCNSLTSIPDISKWNTSNFNDMSNIFGECSSLKLLPDISKWKTFNVTDISNMFIS